MKSLKTFILGSTLAFGFLFGTTVLADSVYTVKSGDTLSSISVNFFGTNEAIDQIAKDNNIQDVNLIFPGQELTIKSDYQTSQPVQEVAYSYTAPQQSQQSYSAPHQQYTGSSSSAKEWIAQRESGGDYNASNGYHIGRYQLDPSYLNGDYSPANQERVADQYVANRYGSWENAQAFWMNNGWY